jgi:hypothetical protein
VIRGSERGEEPSGESLPTDSDPFSEAEFSKTPADLSTQFAANANRRFEFHKGSQQFIGEHNETLSVAAT